MYSKRIVCLTDSCKYGGRCIAGKEVLPNGLLGGWIRPVSSREHGKLRRHEYVYDGGLEPERLDIVEIPFQSPAPRGHQTENHLIAPGRWMKHDEFPRQNLAFLLDRPPALWINGDNTVSGMRNCVSQQDAAMLSNSLCLIRPENLVLTIGSRTVGEHPKRTYRAGFGYNGVQYLLHVTDPAITNYYGRKEEGDYPMRGAEICVSLTEPYSAEAVPRCHKLVAAIFP